jgi:hypothetical protein
MIFNRKPLLKRIKLNRAKFNRDKALKLAQVGVDTATAIVKGIAEFGPPPSPAGIAAIASAWNHWNHTSLGNCQSTISIIWHSTISSSTWSWSNRRRIDRCQCIIIHSQYQCSDNRSDNIRTRITGQNIPVSQVVVLESDITGTQNKVKLQEAKTSF